MLHRVWQPESGRQLSLHTVSEAKAAETVRSQAAALEGPQQLSTAGAAEPGSAAASVEEQAAPAVNGSTAEDAEDSADEEVAFCIL